MRTPLRATLTLAVAVLALAACGGAVQVEPPVPQGETAAACRRLNDLLPGTLDGAERVESEPKSPYVAVWGAGEIALRCGVPRPAAMAPTDRLSEINGVGWFADPKLPTLYTAVTGSGYVEVTIARTHDPGEVLGALSAPIAKTLPA
ncbi:DUF3515 domain-containing protein [Spongiactinospora sp. TRM90649]|uniref:DUF3515 domain-containing protein n=1 Tax=Spongiactinospora sp. TRM90649 TaxID=3031114 RepID=UPI0023F6F39F|nr:DUF3515 domain-containing protein [Spongiactinospora sp. TRM90649]MDF5753335.1 DUF3515 domain-containing protein [Spongiactinospora sp. TRM90649]